VIHLRAFNALPGLVVLGANDEPHVVTGVDRDPNSEVVTLTFRGTVGTVEFDYCANLDVVGVCVNPDDADDTDYGVDP
jgi:hypothetical protein